MEFNEVFRKYRYWDKGIDDLNFGGVLDSEGILILDPPRIKGMCEVRIWLRKEDAPPCLAESTCT